MMSDAISNVVNIFNFTPTPNVQALILALQPNVVPTEVRLNENGMSELVYEDLGTKQRGMYFPVEMPKVFKQDSDGTTPERRSVERGTDFELQMSSQRNLGSAIKIFRHLAEVVGCRIDEADIKGGIAERERTISRETSNSPSSSFSYLEQGLFFAHSTNFETRMRAMSSFRSSSQLFLAGQNPCMSGLIFDFAAMMIRAEMAAGRIYFPACNHRLDDGLINSKDHASYCWEKSFKITENSEREQMAVVHRYIHSTYFPDKIYDLLSPATLEYKLDLKEGNIRRAADDLLRMAFYCSFGQSLDAKMKTAEHLRAALSIYRQTHEPENYLSRISAVAEMLQRNAEVLA